MFSGVNNIEEPGIVKSCDNMAEDFYQITSCTNERTPNTLCSQRFSFNHKNANMLQQALPAIPGRKQRNDSIKMKSTGSSIVTDQVSRRATRLGTAADGKARGGRARYDLFNNLEAGLGQGEAELTSNKSPQLTDSIFAPMAPLRKSRKS